jgi:hypothetical protein
MICHLWLELDMTMIVLVPATFLEDSLWRTLTHNLGVINGGCLFMFLRVFSRSRVSFFLSLSFFFLSFLDVCILGVSKVGCVSSILLVLIPLSKEK